MLFCKDCGRVFTDSEIVEQLVPIVYDEVEVVETCPYCGSADIAYGNEDRY